MTLFRIKKIENKVKIYLLGLKIFTYTKKPKTQFEKMYARRFEGFTPEELEFCVKEQFRNWHDYYPNLINPRTFNEKLTWEKLYYHNPLMTICADKVKAREYFLEKTNNNDSHLVKQFDIYNDASQVDFEKLPQQFVLKSNWGSGRQIIVKDKSKLKARKIKKMKKEISKWTDIHSNHYYASFEYGYKNIVPKIVCEEFLNFEYKLEFFCFNGQPKFFWIVLNDKTAEVQANFYNLDWTIIPVENHYPNFVQDISKPECFDEILNIAKTLCGDFPFVRCDFYITKDSYRFSEMTFFHWGCSQQYNPISYDELFGSYMKLPEEKNVEGI